MYKVENLSFKYKKSKQNTLSNISFSLTNGKLNVLVGENGAGKTTIMDCIAGINKTIYDNVLPEQQSIVYMTQNMFLSPNCVGKDVINLIKGMSSKTEGRYFDKKITEQLETKELEKLEHLTQMTIGKMSEGEKKWLYITLLSALDRKLYLFDEPTSGIDPLSRKLIIKRLKIIAEEKVVLISSHQLQDLYNSDSKIIFINKGKKIYDNDIETWLNDMGTQDIDEAFEETINKVF
ncbi:ATP-binding cassette domain-containing protein [Mammaliicoccus lentus]|uniref:ATP-binding cassette domain-containing protein n=1 Tax=Mammaliicoccus lentus TaxID=42858 RepID=UPI001C4F7657|nr:AAA family ATPase [Mammaliicoccus lentus]MBW0763135.1 ATP-binding cassette domain-containing protein [Mammaliicoccus lentus]